MKVLITGIHGFVGTNLRKYLQHTELYGIDRVQPVVPEVIKTFCWEELRTEAAPSGDLPDLDAVIHLAGKAHDLRNEALAQEYFDINTGLTQQVFDFFLASAARTFIFFSSVAAVTDCVVGHTLTEDVIPTPKGPYGESKIRAEEYILDRCATDPYCVSGKKKVYILRPCMIHGPGYKGNLNLLYNVVKKGIPRPLADFENRHSFASIDNICYVVEQLLNRDIPSGIYHVGDDEAISTNELIRLISEITEKNTPSWKFNKGLMERCAGVGSLLHLPLNIERLRKLTENFVVSNARIKAALGIKEMPVRAEDGLRKTIRSFETDKVAVEDL